MVANDRGDAMNINRFVVLIPTVFMLGACSGSWSTAEVERPGSGSHTSQTLEAENPAAAQTASLPKTSPDSILVTETDISSRPYSVIGDISVTFNKTTIFHPDPTKELVNMQLKEEAATLGADAVILVRYGTPGVSLFSWGSLDGKGRAFKFK